MPEKTKDPKNENLKAKTTAKKASKSAKANSSATKDLAKTSAQKTVEKKNAEKKSASKKAGVSKTTVSKKIATSNATSATNKKTSAKKATTTSKAKTSAKKKTSTSKARFSIEKKSATSKKTVSKKTVFKKAAPKKVDIVEYYDLPYRYNQTIVKVLAQTPTNLFIYWDISDEDRENYKKQFGENFFENTKPVLKIYNDTMNYSFEIDINDFANSWYLHVNDSKCNYRVELGRRPINNYSDINTDYIYVSTSNKIESPNDKILFNKMQKMVYFKNVKTNSTKSKSVATLSFIRNMGKIYNIYDLYKEIYKNENLEEFNNPTSSFL